jgi:hypothetical protein
MSTSSRAGTGSTTTPRPPGPAARPPGTPRPAVPSDPAAIERVIKEHQRGLAVTVDELTTRLSPKEVARRAKESARQKAQNVVTDEDGILRVERVAAIGAATVALLGLLIWRKAR